MRRGFTSFFASIGRHHFGIVDRQPLVGVDGHTEEPRVGLEKDKERRRKIAFQVERMAVENLKVFRA